MSQVNDWRAAGYPITGDGLSDYINQQILLGKINAAPSNGGTTNALLARSAGLAGMGTDFAFTFDDFDKLSLSSDWSPNGTWAQSNTKGPGVWTCLSSAANIIQKSITNPCAPFVFNPATQPWHLAGRFLITQVPQAGDIKGVAFTQAVPATDAIRVGIHQAISATKYTFRVTKAGASVSALSTISIDQTNFHKGEIWFDPTSGNCFGSVDNETPVLITTAANLPIVGLEERHGVEVGAGASVDNFWDYVYAATVRTST